MDIRGGKPHPLGKLDNALFAQVCDRLNRINELTSAEKLLEPEHRCSSECGDRPLNVI